MQYIDCKTYAAEILEEVRQIPDKKKLTIFTVGDDPASKSYVKGKLHDCEFCGIPCEHVAVEADSSEIDLAIEIFHRNLDDEVGGIIVQLPLPPGWNEKYLTEQVHGIKDVDGLRHDSAFQPCTPEGIIYILKKEIGDLTGKNVLVIGRGKLVGKPIVQMLLDEDCTVTVAHSKTKDLYKLLNKAEIIISAAGKPGLVDLTCCWNAEIVIDVGVNRNADGKLCGDCFNFKSDSLENLKVTPVPGGIGLMTRAMLMKHVGDASCM